MAEVVAAPLPGTPPSTTGSQSCCRLERINASYLRAWPSKHVLPSVTSLPSTGKTAFSQTLSPHKMQLGKKAIPHTHPDTEIAQHSSSEAGELTFK